MGFGESISARPPTPPRSSMSRSGGQCGLAAPQSRTKEFTPPDSSPISSGEVNPGLGKKPKRVGWSSCIEDITEAQVKHIQPSREQKPFKSILKPRGPLEISSSPSQSMPDNPALLFDTSNDSSALIHSVVQQLAMEERSVRCDAYCMLTWVLQHYDDIPDFTVMETRMSLLLQFMQRDMLAKIPSTGVWDTYLITKALRLVAIFIWNAQLSCLLTDDFRMSVLDQAIHIFESRQPPKVLVVHYMHILSLQTFGPSVMTPHRAARLILALDTVGKSVQGKAITCERLAVHQRLVKQAPAVMISSVRCWIDHLFAGMLSTTKYIRSRAVTLGLEVGRALGNAVTVSKAFKDMFSRKLKERTFSRYLEQRLTEMIGIKAEGPDVPKIWSVIVLSVRSRPGQFEHWEHSNVLLLIIQKCFNSGDQEVKIQANIAWNRMMFVIRPDAGTSRVMMGMLRQPIKIQLEKKIMTAHVRDAVLASLSCLLYYSLRPCSEYNQLDINWEEHVVRLVEKPLILDEANPAYGFRVLSALFRPGQHTAWNEQRALESQPITPEELPGLDPKWVRSRTRRLLKTCESIFRNAPWLGKSVTDDPTKQFWKHFTKTIGDAGSMEIKTSSELTDAVAHLVNFFQRIWKGGPSALNAQGTESSDIFIDRFGFLVTAAVDSLGPMYFTEKILYFNAEQNWEAIGTPSRRQAKRATGAVHSPVAQIFQLLAFPGAECTATPAFCSFAEKLVETCCGARKSSKASLEIFDDCLTPEPDPHMSAVTRELWVVIARLAIPVVVSMGHGESMQTGSIDAEYEHLVNILKRGLNLGEPQCSSIWHNLFRSTVSNLIGRLGEGAVVRVLIEPLAESLSCKIATSNLGITFYPGTWIIDALFEKKNPADKHHSRVETDRENYNVTSTYNMINILLQTSYHLIPDTANFEVVTLLSSVAGLVSRCPLQAVSGLLKSVDKGAVLWIQDAERKVRAEDRPTGDVYQAVSWLLSRIAIKLIDLI